MSIVRIGLAETKKFADGYDAIFAKKSAAKSGAKPKKPAKRPRASKAKAGGKKKSKK